MQIKIFNVPMSDNGEMIDEMNKFLNVNKVMEVVQNFSQSMNCWSFCVKYLPQLCNGTLQATGTIVKTDYKQLLGQQEFEVFTLLRKCRKQIADEMALPAYAVFTDEELSGIAKLPEMKLGKIKTIKGIGEKKCEKYGARLFELYEKLIEENNKNRSALEEAPTA